MTRLWKQLLSRLLHAKPDGVFDSPDAYYLTRLIPTVRDLIGEIRDRRNSQFILSSRTLRYYLRPPRSEPSTHLWD